MTCISFQHGRLDERGQAASEPVHVEGDHRARDVARQPATDPGQVIVQSTFKDLINLNVTTNLLPIYLTFI